MKRYTFQVRGLNGVTIPIIIAAALQDAYTKAAKIAGVPEYHLNLLTITK